MCGSGAAHHERPKDWVTLAAGYRIQARELARLLLWGREFAETAERADGDCVCSICRMLYRDHPELSSPTYHLLCSGKVVKL